MQRATRRWLLRLGLGAALFGALAWIFSDLAGAGLTNWDDDRFITYNPLFRVGGWPYIYAALTQIQFEAYQPLHLLSYLPDRVLWPDWPPGFHLVNLALFAADLVLLWRLVRRHTSELAAFAAIAVFALHPLCVEPVAWVTDRKDLLMVLFFVLALGQEDRHAAPRPLALTMYVGALLTKSSSVCFPIILFAWLRWVRGRPVREALVRSAGYAVAALAVSLAVFLIWRNHAMIVRGDAAPPVEVAATVATYASHVLWPVDLGPAYPNDTPHPILAVVACALAAGALAVGWRRLPARARFAVVAGGGALLPVSNLVPMSLRFADRYLFIVLAVLVLPAAAALDAIAARARAHAARAGAVIALAVVLLAGLEARASARLVPAWESSHALWAHAIAVQPRAFLARLKYSETLQDAQQWQPAVAQLRIAQQLRPESLVPSQHLFQLGAERAVVRGVLAQDVARRWWDQSERAMVDRAAFQQLLAEVDGSAYRTCGDALVMMGLIAWPASDTELLSAARQALDRGLAERARLYLAHVRDRTLPELEALGRRAGARPPRSDP